MKRRVGKSALLAGATLAVCGTAATYAASAEAGESNVPSTLTHEQRFAETPRHTHAAGPRSARILAIHNQERARLNLPPLKWNFALQSEAREWAQQLVRKGRLEHASRTVRNGTGENLWMGTAGNWDVQTMVESFLSEREHFKRGAFPDVSKTGNWADVGHYTQVIWRETKEVGCAVVTEKGNDVLVCRYWPAGNVWGSRAL